MLVLFYFACEQAVIRGLVQSPCGKINVIMTLTFYPPPPSLNVTAVQHRFNTETLILLHLAYTFGIHLC